MKPLKRFVFAFNPFSDFIQAWLVLEPWLVTAKFFLPPAEGGNSFWWSGLSKIKPAAPVTNASSAPPIKAIHAILKRRVVQRKNVERRHSRKGQC